jgi:hypothetical protein
MTLSADITGVTNQFLRLIDAIAPGLVAGLYLRGSLGFGDYFNGQSDVDFTAILAGWPARPSRQCAPCGRQAPRNYSGARVRLPETTCYPRPVSAIPIVVGGNGNLAAAAVSQPRGGVTEPGDVIAGVSNCQSAASGRRDSPLAIGIILPRYGPPVRGSGTYGTA